MKAGIEFRKLAGKARAKWHSECIPSRPDFSFERAIFIAAFADILALRLRLAYIPLLQGLQQIENRVAIIASIREDPYAPPPTSVFAQLSIR